MRIETVMIVHQSPKILLGMKKVNFGKGKYNGFGGKVEDDESLYECAIRETFEEAGITVINPIKLGTILCEFEEEGETEHVIYFYKATEFKGEPIETEEMKPEWFDEDKIPYDKMWDTDRYWMSFLLNNRKFIGYFKFDKDNKIINHIFKSYYKGELI